MLRIMLSAALVAALAACSSEPVRRVQSTIPSVFQSKGEAALAAGLRQYEEGRYGEAAKSLQSALDLGLSAREQVKARKHLAFIHCVSGRERQCRDEFGKALDADPAMELEPAEAGHPIWGPVFRSVKARR